jgi:hypothetical protein
MEVVRVLADLHVADIPAARGFYTEFLRPKPREYDQTVHIQLVTRDASAPLDPVASILTPEVSAADEEVKQRGYEIVYPLTNETWGCGESSSVPPTAVSSTSSTAKSEQHAHRPGPGS